MASILLQEKRSLARRAFGVSSPVPFTGQASSEPLESSSLAFSLFLPRRATNNARQGGREGNARTTRR